MKLVSIKENAALLNSQRSTPKIEDKWLIFIGSLCLCQISIEGKIPRTSVILTIIVGKTDFIAVIFVIRNGII